jgi:pimeloyl-ACP methyl ester carboxylesterase
MCSHRQTAARLAEWMRPDLPPAIARDAVNHTWPSYSGTLRNLVLGAQESADILRVQVPVQLIAGRQDRVLDLAFLRTLPGAHPHVHLEEWPGGHELPLSRPDACATALRRAVQRL